MASTTVTTRLLVVIAILGLGVALLLVPRLFGPPQVELAESYAEVEGEAVFDHSSFDRLLREYVDADGLVDYDALNARSTELDAYIDSLESAPFEELGRDERLALLINAYNAFTLRLILDHYPTASIRDIPGDERWDAVRWGVAGGVYSLTQIEHELVRPNFREPRIHFALVCAAVGCPPLRAETYEGARLEEQLADQARFTHHSDRWIRYAPGADTLELTSLYDWYSDDFKQVAGSVLEFVARHREDLAADLAAGHTPGIRFLSYDWSLNVQGATID